MKTFSFLFMALVVLFPVHAADSESLSKSVPLGGDALGDMPVFFIENRGQMDEAVAYYVLGRDKNLYFTPRGLSITLHDPVKEAARWNVNLEFLGTDGVEPAGRDRKKGRFSYFKGKSSDWKTAIPTFGRIAYEDLWPGIDLFYSSAAGQLKYAFVVEPGADPDRIRLAYRGADKVRINAEGALMVSTPCGCFEDGVPLAYQVKDGVRRVVSMKYRLDDGNIIGYALGAYDPTLELVLDPALFIYCGFIGGKKGESGYGICVDDEGYAYVTGNTGSDHLSFPVKIGPDLFLSGVGDAFVAKIEPTGQDLVYCGYIGGTGGETGFDIAVDNDGYVYLTGTTGSDEASFPVLVGPDLSFNGYNDTYVAKLNPQGTDLVYCGYIGGSKWDEVKGIAVDEMGAVYVTGQTYSTPGSFPLKVGPDLTHIGGQDEAFIAKVAADGSDLVYCGYLGQDPSSNYNVGSDIAVDAEGNAYVIGWFSPDTAVAFITRVNAAGTDFDYFEYLQTDDWVSGSGIAVDDAGCAYITGQTRAALAEVKVGPDLSYNGNTDVFVGKLTPDGQDYEFLGYIGGAKGDMGMALALDAECNLYVAGLTDSPETSFPVLLGPGMTYSGGNRDVFVAKVKAGGTGLAYCGYIGGNDWDWGYGIDVDPRGSAYIIGDTDSSEPSFPTVVGPDLTHNSPLRAADAFVGKVALALNAGRHTLSEQGGSADLYLNGGLDRARRDYVILAGASGTTPGFALPGGLVMPLNWDLVTDLVFALLGTPLLEGFLGELNPAGEADAMLTMPALPPGYVGTKLHFAWCLYSPFDFVSNPVEVEIVY